MYVFIGYFQSVSNSIGRWHSTMPFLFDLKPMPYQRPFPLSVWGDQSTMETLKQYSNMVVSLQTEAEEMRTKIRDLQAKVALNRPPKREIPHKTLKRASKS
jgi:hypothetical protein